MKFEHLTFTDEEVKSLNLEIMKIKFVFEFLRKIHKNMMKKHGHNYCPDAVWRDMQERCILFSNDTEVLITKDRFDKMIKIYREDKNCDHMIFYRHVKEFDPILIMYLRNQVLEC